MISKQTEQKIKSEMKIRDVLEDSGVVLHRRGAQLVGLCPFHDDRSEGSFQVSEIKNMCSCYSCGNIGLDPIKVLEKLRFGNLPEKDAYKQTLRYLAAMYRIEVDDEEPPKVTPCKPRGQVVKRERITWDVDKLVVPFMRYDALSPLLYALRCIPFKKADRDRFERALAYYYVGTYPRVYENWKGEKTDMRGWTIWWYIDQFGYVRSGKVMAYKIDGHRDKEKIGDREKTTWVHSMLKYDRKKFEPDLECLFGMHLLNRFPDAKVNIVESEKTAVICSALYDMKDEIWMATGGLSALKASRLKPLMDAGREIVLYPDIDGEDKWRAKVAEDKKLAAYPKLSITRRVRLLWREGDDPKSDIADLVIRRIAEQYHPTKEEQQVGRPIESKPPVQVGAIIDVWRAQYPEFDKLIKNLDLHETGSK